MNGFDANGGFNVKMGKQAKIKVKVGADAYENLRAQDWKLNPSFAMQDLTPLGYDGKYETPDQVTVEGSMAMFLRTDSKIQQKLIQLFSDIYTRTSEEGGTETLVAAANSALQMKARFFLDATHFYEADITIKGISQGVSVGNKMSFDVTFSVRGLPKYIELISTVALAPTTPSVDVGDTVQLTATVTNPPSGHTLNWVSSDLTKATVDSAGLVTGVAAGSADITCEVLDWGIVVASAVKTVTVSV